MTVLKFPSKADLHAQKMTADEEWDLIEKLNQDVQRLLRNIEGSGRNEQRAHNFLRYHFNVASHTELTIGQMKKAIPLLNQTMAQIGDFNSRIWEIQKAFDEQVIGRGMPWTPWIARKIGRRRMSQLGKNPNWSDLLKEIEGDLEELK